MKPIKWTRAVVLALAASFKAPMEMKKVHPSAYKALRRHGLLLVAFPLDRRQRRKKFTEAELLGIMGQYKTRSDFQRGDPSAYNAARLLGIVAKGFPSSSRYVLFGRVPYTEVELIALCKKYTTIKEFSEKDSGAYQVASRRGLVAEHGPKPIQGVSQAELELLSFLQSLSPDFKTKRFANDYELDCYSEALHLGVEYNGLFWHSQENKDRQYHIKKTKYFESQGIRVIHIWEHEWRDRRPQVENYLRSACRANTVRIGARKCAFKEIAVLEAKTFLAEQHIQGAPKHVILALGAIYEGRLVAVATFGPHHRKGDVEKVLNRFACLPNQTIQGALAKFSKLAFARLGPLKSWADYSKSQGNGYIAAGWKLYATLPPDYFYSDTQGHVISKQSRRKSQVGTPANVTEADHAKEDGLYRIWDCGKIVLTYHKS